MYIDKKVLFNYEQVYLDSFYVFDDGDFIIFGVPDNILENEQTTQINDRRKSAVFDKKTFKPKVVLDISGLASFFNLANNEFGICKDSSFFEIYKFNTDRTSFKEVQTFSNFEGGSSKDIKQMLNGDILITRVYVGYNGKYVYRKNDNNPKYAPYGEKFLFQLEDIDELINLNDKEALGYKKNYAVDSLILKIISIDDYKIIRQNEIKFKDNNNEMRLYTVQPIYKIHKNKLVTYGTKCLYIFGLDNLELETTIYFDKNITKILIRPKENIFLFCRKENKIFKNKREHDGTKFFYEQFLYNIKIDFETNDLIETKEENITDYCGENKELFGLFNYINNGIIALIDKSKIIIYENCDD